MSLQDDKWVRVMADYCTDGVWQKDGAAASADELPISQPLRHRLRAWQSRYDGDEPPQEPEFSADGLMIAKDIKTELPDWTIIYFDEAKSQGIPLWPVLKDRTRFEYEVK